MRAMQLCTNCEKERGQLCRSFPSLPFPFAKCDSQAGKVTDDTGSSDKAESKELKMPR